MVAKPGVQNFLAGDTTNKDIDTLIARAKEAGINNVRFVPSIARGFDYYTDIVFEVFDLNPENSRAMFGGGRYDGLVGMFGVQARTDDWYCSRRCYYAKLFGKPWTYPQSTDKK